MKTLAISSIFLTSVLLLSVFLQGCSSATGPDLDQIELDEYTWTHLGLEDKWVTAVEDTPWGLFAGTREDGVFRLDEETNRWTSLGLDHVHITEIVFAGTDNSTLLVGVRPKSEQTTEAAIFASTDRGNTWLESDGGLAKEQDGFFGAFSLLVDEENPDRIFWGVNTFQLLMSEDVGENWQFVSGNKSTFGGITEFIALSPERDGRIWFGGQTAFFSPVIYRSDDWGRDAEPIFMPQAGGSSGAVLVDDQNPDRLWRAGGGGIRMSTDAGETWEVVYIPEVQPPKEFVRFTGGILLHKNTLFAAGVFEEQATKFGNLEWALFKSIDKGTSWNTLQVPDNSKGPANIAFDQNKNLLIPTANGLWRVER